MKIPNKRELKQIASNHPSDNEPYSFLVNEITLSSDNPLRFRKNLLGRFMKMTVSEKVETINNKIEQNKAQYDLDRQTTKISALSLRHVSKNMNF